SGSEFFAVGGIGWLLAVLKKTAAGTAHTLADYHDGTGRRFRLDDGTRL
ncbi:hypothetical protein SEEH3374_11324, partial [Salmonella enterica subsp. enterica serovar Heidelberg str. RI-11-013374]